MNLLTLPRRRKTAPGRHTAPVLALALAPASGAREPGPAGDTPVPASACLRAIDADGVEHDQMRLDGLPEFVGVAPDGRGVRVAGVALWIGPNGAVMLDSRSAEWWDDLIEAATQARDELVYGGFRQMPAAAADGGVR